jgi:hypothetical protein
MRKLFIICSIMGASLFAIQAKADPTLPTGIVMLAPSGVQVNYLSLNVVTTQTAAPGQPANQPYTNSLSGNYNYAGGTGTILVGIIYYYTTPTVVTPVNFNIASSNYAVIQNTSATALTVWINVAANNANGAPVNAGSGPYVHIPYAGTATVYFPVSGGRYTSNTGFGALDPYGVGYPVTEPLQIDVQAVPAAN